MPNNDPKCQIEKMREQALEKLKSDPVARKRFSELQAKVSRDSSLKISKSIDNIQQVAWGKMLSNSLPSTVAAAQPSGVPTTSPPHITTPSLPLAASTDRAKPSPTASSQTSAPASLMAASGTLQSKPAAIGDAKKATSEPTASVAAVNGTEEGHPYVAFSMKSAACEMEATAQRADLVSKDMLRAKAAALRAAAEEIEKIANADESTPPSDAKFAQV